MEPAYPERPSHFAHYFVRVLHKSCAAQEIGHGAFCLLTVIAHTEDASRYRGPVTFWNSQLQETLGFSKWDTFDRARQKAIDAGWLVYEAGGKRLPGKYFVTIPRHFEGLTDAPLEACDHGFIPATGDNRGYKAGIDAGIKRGQSGVQSGDKSGEPPTLYLNPVPNPVPVKVVVVGGSGEPNGQATPKWVSALEQQTPPGSPARDFVDRIAASVRFERTPRQAAAPLAATIRKGKVRDLTAYLARVAKEFETKYDPEILTRRMA